MKSVIIALLTSACVLVASAAPAAKNVLPRRAFFGAQLQPVPDSLRGKGGILDSGGVLLGQIYRNSSAEAGGLKSGDVLLRMDDKPLSGVQDVLAALKGRKGGDKLKVDYAMPGGRRVSRSLKLKPFPKETPPDFVVLYETAQIGDSLRRIIITKPRLPGKLPVVVLLGGLGCYSLDLLADQSHPYRTILYALTREGFVTVRVEKTGMGDSQGPPCAGQSFDDEVNGLVAAIRSLTSFSYMDTSRILLLGHSMGGIEAPVVANRVPVKGIIAIATTGINWLEYELINFRRQTVMTGMDYDSVEIACSKKELAAHKLMVERLSPEEIIRQDSTLAGDVQYPVDYHFIQQLDSLNIAREWKTVTAPVLLIYGASDFVTAANEHTYIRDEVNHYHPGHAEFVEVPDMDHFFNKVSSQQASFDNLTATPPNTTFSDQVLPVIENWAKKTIANP
jgi:pimeloyl-ACP methyl ester carboxylesterase